MRKFFSQNLLYHVRPIYQWVILFSIFFHWPPPPNTRALSLSFLSDPSDSSPTQATAPTRATTAALPCSPPLSSRAAAALPCSPPLFLAGRRRRRSPAPLLVHLGSGGGGSNLPWEVGLSPSCSGILTYPRPRSSICACQRSIR
jgi:hypothetical protein